MRRLFNGIDAVSDWSGKVVSMLIFFMIGILIFEIILRYFFDSPTMWAHETSQQMFGIYSILIGGYVLLQRKHIKIDLFYGLLSPRGKAILDSVTYPIFFLAVGVLLVYGWQVGLHSVLALEKSQTPLHPPIYHVKMAIPIGALLILLQGLKQWIHSICMAVRGKELA